MEVLNLFNLFSLYLYQAMSEAITSHRHAVHQDVKGQVVFNHAESLLSFRKMLLCLFHFERMQYYGAGHTDQNKLI